MSVLGDLNSVRSINSGTIINVSNENFHLIIRALLKFLNDFKYDEENVSISGSLVSANEVSIKNSMNIVTNGTTQFSIDNNGKLFSKNIFAEAVVKGTAHNHTYNEGFPTHGNPGDIVYGRNYDHQNVDFYGYINNVGWVSLTGGAGGEGSQTLNMPFVVTGVVAEEDLDQGGGPYIIGSGEHEGTIALWDGVNSKWEFVEFPENSYTINTDDGKVYISQTGSMGGMEWIPMEDIVRIGYDEDGNENYTDGEYEDFDKDTRLGIAIDRFNRDFKKIYDRVYVAFKNIQGVAHTSREFGYLDEDFAGGVLVPASKVFAYDISDVDDAVDAGLVDKVTGFLTHIDSTKAYSLRKGGKPVVNAVSRAFGNDYTMTVYDASGVEIPSTDYIYQYASGVLIYTGRSGVTPAKVEYYEYTGDTVADAIGKCNVKLATSDAIKRVTSAVGNMNNRPTGLKITSIPKVDSELIVKVNGVSVTVCDGLSDRSNYACYFLGDGVVKNFSNIAEGDELIWNSITAGYILDQNDVVSFEYLCASTSGSSSGGGGGGGDAATTIKLEAAEEISGGSFVMIGNDGKVYVADSVEGKAADGFVQEGVPAGDECTVYLSGIVDVGSAVILTPGEYVYLGASGRYSSDVDQDSITILQNVGTVVDSGTIFVHISEPVNL